MSDSWETKELGDVVSMRGGGTPSTEMDEYWGGDVLWLTPSEVSHDRIHVTDTERNPTELGLNNCSAKVLPAESVLMTSRATVGVPVINQVPMATNQGFIGMQTEDCLDPYYLLYWIKANQKLILSRANGATFKEISQKSLKQLEILLPPIEVQRNISSFLRTLDEKIEVNRAMAETLEDIAHAIYTSWFVDYEPYTDFKESELGDIPEEFEVSEVGEVLELEYGDSLPERERFGEEFPVIGSNGPVGTHQESCVDGPGIVVGRKGTIGTVNLVPNDFWVIDTAFYVDPKDGSDILFHKHLLESLRLTRLNEDAAVPGLNRNTAYSQQFARPPSDDIEDFVNLVRPLYQQIWAVESENKSLAELRDYLLPQLLSGEVRLGGDDA